MLMRTDPFREFDRLTQQAFGTRYRPSAMPMDAYRQGDQFVVNFDLPNIPETYVHRIGRTARAGASGVAFSFCADDERPFLKGIERLTKQKIDVVPESVIATRDGEMILEDELLRDGEVVKLIAVISGG